MHPDNQQTLLYTIMIQTATCFDSLAVIIRLISKISLEVYGFCIVHCNIIICSAYKTGQTDVCKNILYHTCIYNRLPEDEPSGSKHEEDIKN